MLKLEFSTAEIKALHDERFGDLGLSGQGFCSAQK